MLRNEAPDESSRLGIKRSSNAATVGDTGRSSAFAALPTQLHIFFHVAPVK
jgi:hypothetical protein